MGDQQPARAPFFHGVQSVTGRRLHHLLQKEVKIAAHRQRELLVAAENLVKTASRDYERLPGELYDSPLRRAGDSDHRSNPDNPFVAYRGDLDRGPVLRSNQQSDGSLDGEIDGRDVSIRAIQYAIALKLNEGRVLKKQMSRSFRQPIQYAILAGGPLEESRVVVVHTKRENCAG